MRFTCYIREFFEISVNELEIFFNNWIIRWGISPEYFKNIYKEHSFGVGYQVRVGKRRPLFLRGILQHSNLIHALKVGQADVTYGNFRFDGERFESDKVNVYYGQVNHNLRTTLELSYELYPGFQIFANASYLLPFSEKRIVYLWERDQLFLFRRRARRELDERILVTQDERPFDQDIVDYKAFIFMIGVSQRM